MILQKLGEKDEMEYVCIMNFEKAYERGCGRKLFLGASIDGIWGKTIERDERFL